MRVALINPKLKTWSPNIYPPLGLCYIAAALERADHDVTILDMNSHRVSDGKMLEQVCNADWIGITGMITEYQEVVRLVRTIKDSLYARIVVLGGPLATTHPKEILLSSGADLAVIGEGEKTVVELASVINNRGYLPSIEGVLYNGSLTPAFSHSVRVGGHIDGIPYPARHLLDMEGYSTHHFKTFGVKAPKIKSTTMITSRGCPYRCTFCHKEVGGLKWRARSPENIIGEMTQLRDNYGMEGFVFNDDTFVVSRKRVLDFCGLLVERDMDISWYCNGRVNLMDEEMLDAMAQSGCVGIAYGIESGNQGILDSVKKGITLEQVRRITKLTKRAGIQVTGYFMLGVLGDTKQTIRETLDFAEQLNLDFYGFGITSPIPGTEMYQEAERRGLVGNGRLEDWSFHAWVNLTGDCTKEELERYNDYAFRKFTIEKRWGKRYLLNWRLWWEGLRTLAFLARKRNVGEMLRKVVTLLTNIL